jgi:thymidine kinase
LTEQKDVWHLYDVIAIDEGQFFKDVSFSNFEFIISIQIVEFSENAANNGKIVIISCLDGNFMRKGFDPIIELIPMAEKIKKLAAICKNCGTNASFTFRTCFSNEIELIGGDSIYKPLCRECFNEEQYQ